jgi:hypothetical protein
MLMDEDGIKLELTISAKKDDLLKTLRDNLEKHEKEHKEACEGWHKKLIEQLEASQVNVGMMLDSAKSGRDGNEGARDDNWTKQFPDVADLVPEDWHDKPRSFAHHYRDAIEMLEIHTEEKIALGRALHQQLVQDKWSWRGHHAKSMRKYSNVGRV